jgi:predicted RNase H-like nuclease (RuvC/YqgF family)
MKEFIKKPIFLGIVILITGFILGIVVSNVFIDNKFGPQYNGGKFFKDQFKRRMIRTINPDENQLKEIEPIIDKYSERTSEITENHFKEFTAILDSLQKELAPILTDAQKEKLKERKGKMKRFKFKKRHKRMRKFKNRKNWEKRRLQNDSLKSDSLQNK